MQVDDSSPQSHGRSDDPNNGEEMTVVLSGESSSTAKVDDVVFHEVRTDVTCSSGEAIGDAMSWEDSAKLVGPQEPPMDDPRGGLSAGRTHVSI